MEGESSETGTVVECLIIKFYFILSDWCQLLHYWQNKMFYQCSTEEVHSQAVKAVMSRYFSKLLFSWCLTLITPDISSSIPRSHLQQMPSTVSIRLKIFGISSSMMVLCTMAFYCLTLKIWLCIKHIMWSVYKILSSCIFLIVVTVFGE